MTRHNLEYSMGMHSYDVSMNHMGDMVGKPQTVPTSRLGKSGFCVTHGDLKAHWEDKQ